MVLLRKKKTVHPGELIRFENLRGNLVEGRLIQSVGISLKSSSILTICGAAGDFNRSHYKKTVFWRPEGLIFRSGEEDKGAPKFPFRRPNRKRVGGRIDKYDEPGFQAAPGDLSEL